MPLLPCIERHGKGTWEEDAITAMHCKVFYMKSFPVANTHEVFAKPQSKSASTMALCHPKTQDRSGLHQVCYPELGEGH